VPYSTKDVADSFVDHVITAELVVMAVAATAEIVGALLSRTIVSVKPDDQFPTASLYWTETVFVPDPELRVHTFVAAKDSGVE